MLRSSVAATARAYNRRLCAHAFGQPARSEIATISLAMRSGTALQHRQRHYSTAVSFQSEIDSSSASVTIPLKSQSGSDIPIGRFVYRDGWRPTPRDFQKATEARSLLSKDAAGSLLEKADVVLKVLAPMDVSGDSRGGQGAPTPAVLLLHNKDKTLIRHIDEFEVGHIQLLRLVASNRGKIYVFAQYASTASNGNATLSCDAQVPQQTGNSISQMLSSAWSRLSGGSNGYASSTTESVDTEQGELRIFLQVLPLQDAQAW